MDSHLRGRIPFVSALETLQEAREDRIVVTSMGATREWTRLPEHPLDFHFVPSTMGGAPALGLGLALAQPQREVIALSGDGSLLMSLGSLVTIAAAGATNLTLIVLVNGIYEVTGRQKTAAIEADADYAALARASGITSVVQFEQIDAWKEGVSAALAAPGPRVIVLAVEPVAGDYRLSVPGPMQERLAQFRAALAGP